MGIAIIARPQEAEYGPEELRQVEVLLGQGKTVVETVKLIGLTETMYHRWRNEYPRPRAARQLAASGGALDRRKPMVCA